MKKLLMIAAAALMALPVSLSAQKKTTDQAMIVQKDGKTIYAKEITVENDGDYKYKASDGTGGMVKKAKARFAWIPMPAEVAAADAKLASDPAAAIALYEAAAQQYKRLGWEAYCLSKKAQAMKNSKKDIKEIIAFLKEFDKYDAANPKDEVYVSQGRRLLGQIYLENKMWKDAMGYIDRMTDVEDDNEACSAYILRGDILRAQAEAKNGTEKKEALEKAVMAYFTAALLFDKTGDQPLALYRSWEVMTELNDARAEKFSDMLKKKYPDNEYTKRLK